MMFHKYKNKIVLFVAIMVMSYSSSIAQQMAENTDSIQVDVSDPISVLFGERKYDELVGNVNSVSGDELVNYPAISVEESLAGKLPGLFILQNNGNVGENNFTTYIRGNSGSYIVMIDGFERPLINIPIEQIAEIKVLKDPVSKALYGGSMTNGIVLVTTKRGFKNKNEFRATIQRGIKMPTAIPEYLNAADYATQYNKAIENDNGGIMPDGAGYTDEQIAYYKDQSRPYQYPDVDYYDEFLNNSMNITRVNTEYYGGNEKTQVYFQAGYQNEGGLEKYGEYPLGMDLINLRGNLDANFNDYIKVLADFSGYLGERSRSGKFEMATLSDRRPNDYPIFAAQDTVAGTASFKDNPYGAQAQSGYIKETYVQMQSTIGFEFDLRNVVKGLSIKPTFAFDIAHQQNLNKVNTVGIYEIAEFDEDGNPLTLNELQLENLATSQTLGDDNYSKRWALNIQGNWNRTFGDHKVNADLLYHMSSLAIARTLDDYNKTSISGRAHYSYKGKYNAEGALAYVGSTSYAKENRYKLLPALGAGWVISKESFLENSFVLNFLKLNGAWGITADGTIGNRLWQDSWTINSVDNNAYKLNSSVLLNPAKFSRIANENIDWPTTREIDINVEGRLFKHFGFKATYFDYLTTGTINKLNNVMPGIIGGNSYLPSVNYGERALRGTELELSYFGKTGDWTYSIGTHMTMSKSEKIKINELPDPNYTTVGDAVDDIRGYNAIGYYSQSDIDNMLAGNGAVPSYMDPSDIRVGNIMYQDVNEDGVIDKYDQEVIGNSTPRLMYGANINLGWKGIELYASFLGYGQYDRLINNTNYYHAYDTRKYSTAVVNGLPNGNAHPMLTTGTPVNDTQTSSYWIADGSFLKLKNVTLSYTLPSHLSETIHLGEVKFYVYGTNLFTVSEINDLDPESLTAGVVDYPLFSTYAAGLSISF
ncbi:SusC/RagA family TonB-linked outer membrane protein [Saccharicrinis aurantiacus]|uniref:SusC/RagA family TonB-linked outer membrane protein n=1 Tax=Saccharicrinis aurantiacus TaxID=1849719 RepID=UPI002492FDA8|nr:SusC/RagA family TonB-linked outer membrane protein [Saccharicrinis aurantiacus]